MSFSHSIDVGFEGVLIYEGAVLAQRRVLKDRAVPLPTITEMVTRIMTLPYGWVLPVFIVGWLAKHFKESR